MSEELLKKASEIVVRLRELERGAERGEEAREALRQLKREAKESGLYRSFSHLFRKVERSARRF